jgi:DNA-binding SARP family transcriptional activator
VGASARPDHDDPDELLARAAAMEPGLRLTERTALLDRLEAVLATRPADDPATRAWQWQLTAERAVDAARLDRIDLASELARRVLDGVGEPAGPDQPWTVGLRRARARATDALGRALAWTGTEGATRDAEVLLTDAAEQYAAVGDVDRQAYAVFWVGNTIYGQNGELAEGERRISRAIDLLAPGSAWRATMVSFRADLLIALGRWDDAEHALEDGASAAAALGDRKARAYVAWSRARLTSVRGDAAATERLLHETERDTGDWFDMDTGTTFLADAAEMLDRVGLREQARSYLERAQARDPADEFVRQADALLLARGGEPGRALDALQELTRGQWLEKRSVWRHTLFAAWATFRVGRVGAGELAARALDQAARIGPLVAGHGEPALCHALAPLAEAAGSAPARALLAPSGRLVVRLLGPPHISRDGRPVALPGGQPAELVRMVAAARGALPVDTVIDRLFPDASPASGRQRLRQVLTRLRAQAEDVIVRDGDQLRLADAWIDLDAFRDAAARVRSARGGRRIELAYTALALWSGPPLATDAYAGWAGDIRPAVTAQYLGLLDLVAEDAAARNSRHEALTALASAMEVDPHDDRRLRASAAHLEAIGAHSEARRMLDQARRLSLGDD